MEILFLTRTAGNYLQAGLPNITGTLTNTLKYNYANSTGALYAEATAQAGNLGNNSSNQRTIGIDASLCNSIYGNSTTVQPPALTTRLYIKF